MENGFYPRHQLSLVHDAPNYTPKKLTTIEPYILYKDEILNKEIQNFKTNGSSIQSSRYRNEHNPEKINYDAQEQRL